MNNIEKTKRIWKKIKLKHPSVGEYIDFNNFYNFVNDMGLFTPSTMEKTELREQFDEETRSTVFDCSFGSTDRAYIQWLEKKHMEVMREANNVLYLNENFRADHLDYEQSLQNIFTKYKDEDELEKLEYIDETK